MHALIIEDEPIIAMLIEDRLRVLGYASFDFAATQDEAVAAARTHAPDLITSDVRLAAGCGIAAVEEIRGEQPVAVIFITATDAEVRARLPDAPVIVKPFAQAELERVLVATARAAPASLSA